MLVKMQGRRLQPGRPGKTFAIGQCEQRRVVQHQPFARTGGQFQLRRVFHGHGRDGFSRAENENQHDVRGQDEQMSNSQRLNGHGLLVRGLVSPDAPNSPDTVFMAGRTR